MATGRFAFWTRLANALSISRRELNWAAAVAGLVILLTFIPYVYGWAVTPPGTAYMGYVYEKNDHSVHSAWVSQAKAGRWLFVDLFTTEPQRPHFFNLYFLLLGRLARHLRLSVTAVEQLGRAVFGWAFLIVVYAFAAQCTQSLFTRRLALLLVAFSSGLGWLVNPRLPAVAAPAYRLATWAMDYAPAGRGMMMPEAVTFASLMIYGLFAVSYFLLAVTFYLLWLAWGKPGSWKLAAWAGVSAMALANVHSYDIVTVWAVGGVALFVLAIVQRRFPRRELGMLAVVVALSAIPVVYQYHVLRTSQVFREKANTPTLSPPFYDRPARTAADYLRGEAQYVLTFGLCAFAALPAIVRAFGRRRHPGWLFLAVWALLPFGLVYLPVSFQRKIAEGMQVPLCMLAAFAVGDMLLAPRVPAGRGRKAVARPIPPARQWTVAGLLLLAVIPSNIGLTGLILSRLQEDVRYRTYGSGPPSAESIDTRALFPSYYLHAQDLAALEWLAAHSRPRDAVLCLPAVGQYLPRVSARFTYCGHWAETLNVRWKFVQVLRFFGSEMGSPDGEAPPPMTDEERLALARANRIRYVYYGFAEQAVAGVTPRQMKFLKLVYRNPRVQIYRFAADARRADG